MLDAEVRIGELMRDVPKATKGNQYTGKMVSNTDVTNQTKADVIESMGFNKMQVQRFETLAAHPEIVAQANCKEDAKRKQRPGHRKRNGSGPMPLYNGTTPLRTADEDNIIVPQTHAKHNRHIRYFMCANGLKSILV